MSTSTSQQCILIIILIFCITTTTLIEAKWLWSKCTNHNNITSTTSCKSIKTIPEGSFTNTKIFPKYAVLYYYWDTPQQELCDDKRVHSFMELKNSTSCEDYFCDRGITLVGNNTEIGAAVERHVTILNYCQYCQRADYFSFHDRVSSNTCKAFTFPDSKFCSPSVGDGYPLYFATLVQKKFSQPYMCNCPYGHSKGGRYAHKCDFFAFYILPLSQEVYPIIMIVIAALLLIISIVFYSLPFIIVRVKSIVNNRRELTKEIGEMFDTYILITLFMQIHFLLEIIEMIFTLPIQNIVYVRNTDGLAGFFQSLAYLAFLFSMSTLVTLWVNVLYKTKHKEKDAGMIWPLKITLAVIYIIIASLGIVPFVSLFKRARQYRLINSVFFPVSVIAATVLGIGFAVYGVRLYLKIRETTKLGVFKLKFNRFMIATTTLHLLFAIQMIFITIEHFVRGKTTFGITYRSLNLQFLFLTLICLDLAFMYQTFRQSLVIEAYPFMAVVFSVLDVSRCMSWMKSRIIGDEDKNAESFYYRSMNTRIIDDGDDY
jgi:hypothetical protein